MFLLRKWLLLRLSKRQSNFKDYLNTRKNNTSHRMYHYLSGITASHSKRYKVRPVFSFLFFSFLFFFFVVPELVHSSSLSMWVPCGSVNKPILSFFVLWFVAGCNVTAQAHYSCSGNWCGYKGTFLLPYFDNKIFLPLFPTKNGAQSRSGWTEIQETYGNVHPNLVLVIFVRTKWNSGKAYY